MKSRTEDPYLREILKEMTTSDIPIVRNTGYHLLDGRARIRNDFDFKYHPRGTPYITEAFGETKYAERYQILKEGQNEDIPYGAMSAIAHAWDNEIYICNETYYQLPRKKKFGDLAMYDSKGIDKSNVPDSTNKEFLITVLCHELNHVLNPHMGYMKTGDRERWLSLSDEEQRFYNFQDEFRAHTASQGAILNWPSSYIKEVLANSFKVHYSHESLILTGNIHNE